MYDRFKKKTKHLVGISLDSKTEKLLSFVNQFSESLDIHVRLVHIVENWQTSVAYPSGFLYTEFAFAALEEIRSEAEQRVTDFVENYNASSGVAITGANASRGLISEAESNGARMIICSASEEPSKFFPNGFSTAISLMAESHVPVLVVPESCTQFRKESPTILLADDLTDSCWGAMHLALELALTFKNPKLVHAHIFDSKKEELINLSQKILTKMNLGDIPYDKNFSVHSFVEETEEEVKRRMGERLGSARAILETRSSYESKTYFGKPSEKFPEIVREVAPDIIVFGRHETLHRKPLSIGKMPFTAMMGLGIPTIVVPKLS